MPWACCLGQGHPKTLRTTNLQSITTKCKQRLSLGRSLGRPCPRGHALGMLSLTGSVPAPCERRTYTRKHNPIIFMQWGWELSQQWSSGEFRQIKVCNQKGQKGSTGRLVTRRGLNFCGRYDLQKSIPSPFEDNQVGLVQSMGAKGKTADSWNELWES